MTRLLWFVTHPEVVIDPDVPVTEWPLSDRGVARMARFCERPDAQAIGTVFASAERKARQAADILAAARGIPVAIMAALHENDRSATGYLPPPEFEATADHFFGEPQSSVRGWERAVDAQARIVGAVRAIAVAATNSVTNPGDVAVVSHGAVGALLLCHLLGVPIDRRYDQPGRGGGNMLRIALPAFRLVEAWTDIAP